MLNHNSMIEIVKVLNKTTIQSIPSGDREVTVYLEDGSKISATTSNIALTDMYEQGDFEEVWESSQELIKMVLYANEIEEYKIL